MRDAADGRGKGADQSKECRLERGRPLIWSGSGFRQIVGLMGGGGLAQWKGRRHEEGA